jgi:hypothetical protein
MLGTVYITIYEFSFKPSEALLDRLWRWSYPNDGGIHWLKLHLARGYVKASQHAFRH